MPWTEPSERNLAFSWAWELIDELSRCGLRHIVCSPGSRCTPLTLAASAHPAIETDVVLDERSAAFAALGMGKAIGRPAALICTSGTAAANYFPAVIEARQSGVPLILLTADRPPQLRNMGANQAIDQLKLYGDNPVYFHEAGEPVWRPDDVKRLRMAGDQAWKTSISRRGPAHINLAFRKPLEPEPDFPDIPASRYREGQPPLNSWHPPGTPPLSEELLYLIRQARRPVAVAGPEEQHRSVADTWAPLLARFDMPVLAEPGSGFERQPELSGQLIRRYESLLRPSAPDTLAGTDLILRFGRQPVSKGLELYLKECSGTTHLHIAEEPHEHDATFSTTHRGFGAPPGDMQLFDTLDDEWLSSWREADRRAASKLAAALADTRTLTDGAAIRNGLHQLNENWNLMLSNSLPVRDAALFGDMPADVPTYVNRGASGIDGILSTAVGLCRASDRPTLVVIGDLAFLHDTNALLSARMLRHPLVVLIINNGGGSIFRMLPVSTHEQHFKTFFQTPQQVDLSNLAKAYELAYRRINNVDELNDWMLTAHQEAGLHLVECRTDADVAMQQRRALWL